MLNKTHVVEITKACTVAFMKKGNSLFDVERNMSIGKKKTENGENLFFKALGKRFWSTSKSCSWPTFYQTGFMKR